MEVPAKWTGNGSRMAKPENDWYETKSKLRIRPDGSKKIFQNFRLTMIQNQLQHILSFGKAKMYLIPGRNSRILHFWTAKGVDI
jgi:hypothetical protein